MVSQMLVINMNSLLALLVPILIQLVGIFTPQINDFLSHNLWVAGVGAIIAQVWNHFVPSVGSAPSSNGAPTSLVPPKK
jgi:hypothetical protein